MPMLFHPRSNMIARGAVALLLLAPALLAVSSHSFTRSSYRTRCTCWPG